MQFILATNINCTYFRAGLMPRSNWQIKKLKDNLILSVCVCGGLFHVVLPFFLISILCCWLFVWIFILCYLRVRVERARQRDWEREERERERENKLHEQKDGDIWEDWVGRKTCLGKISCMTKFLNTNNVKVSAKAKQRT